MIKEAKIFFMRRQVEVRKKTLTFLLALAMMIAVIVPIGASSDFIDDAGLEIEAALPDELEDGLLDEGDDVITNENDDPADDEEIGLSDEPAVFIEPLAAFGLLAADEAIDANGGYYIHASATGASRTISFALKDIIMNDSANKSVEFDLVIPDSGTVNGSVIINPFDRNADYDDSSGAWRTITGLL